ncbi:MAG: LytTR family transcriptional regulator [Sediminibacterium sp.]|nr:LytTR family transcriptional regulator [Sediminibacterium sp.]
MITAIAVDDEPVGLDIISKHSAETGLVELKAVFASACDALEYLDKQKIQLVFVDINMPDMSGLDFAERVRDRSLVIFTTAHAEFALQGFDLAATDYLLKPITYTRFLQACQLAATRLSQSPAETRSESNNLFVKDGYNWVKIDMAQLLYAKAEDNYILLVETGKRTLTRMTLSNLLGRLPSDQFIQVHKSFVASLQHIKKIEKDHIVIGGEKIPVSSSWRNQLLETIKDRH